MDMRINRLVIGVQGGLGGLRVGLLRRNIRLHVGQAEEDERDQPRQNDCHWEALSMWRSMLWQMYANQGP